MRRLALPAMIAAVSLAAACESDLGFRPPARPDRVSAAGGPRSITVRFPPVEDATRYVLRWTSGADADVGRLSCDAPPCVIEDLSPEVTYQVTVATRDRAGESDPSIAVSARTLRGDEILLRRGWRYSASTTTLAIVGAGDMDGDGDGELVIGEPEANAVDEAGRLLLFEGDRNGPSEQPDLDLPGAPQTKLGGSLAAIGDVNEDGFADLVAGSPGIGANPGRVLLYRGSLAGLNTVPAWTGSTLQGGAKTGLAVAAGDVNGDGFPDVVSSAPAWTGESGTFGRIDLFAGPGPASGALYPSAVSLTSGDIDGGFGRAIAVADVDADGFDDLAIAIPGFEDTLEAQGRVVVHRWDPAAEAWEAAPSSTFTGAELFGLLGTGLAKAGDTDGDGFDELLVGAPGESPSFDNAGQASLYEASASGLSSAPMWISTGGESAATLGQSVAGPGDLNLDGYDDVAIGVPGGGPAGTVRIFFGSANGLTREEAVEGLSVGDEFGAIVAPAGDLDGDGFPDLAAADNAGHVEVIFGGRPRSTPVVDAGPMVSGSAGTAVRTAGSAFVDEVPAATYTCTWTWGDGGSDVLTDCVPGETAAEHAYAQPGEYDLLLRVEASDGRLGEASTRAVIR